MCSSDLIYKGSRPPVSNKEARNRMTTTVLLLIAAIAAVVWYFTRNQ